MKKIELLSPAGNRESLEAAIYAGCDAVYIGGKFFGARTYAQNFTIEEMEKAISFAHLYGVRVYVTVNTIVYEAEVPSFLRYIENLVKIHVDALIMQDIGMIDLVRQIYPDLEIHASTQMNIHSLDGIRFAEEMGIHRVVLARETSYQTIKKMKENSSIEIEVFGHGALCMGYSGQCFMSYLIGGRSGNRGACAGTCRQKYYLKDIHGKALKSGYLLSMRDLNTLSHLEQFITLGIDSLKIEGRMKSPAYIYFITSIYRKAIDSYYETGKVQITEENIKKIAVFYNRLFTKGYLFEEENDNVVNTYRPNHMGTSLGTVVKVKPRSIWIQLHDSIHIKDGIRILNEKKDCGFSLMKMRQNGKDVLFAPKDSIIEIEGSFAVAVLDKVIKTTDALELSRIEKILKEKKRTIPITGKIEIKENKPIILSITDGTHFIKVESPNFIEKARTRETTKEEVKKRLEKLGNTPYCFQKIEVQLEKGLFIPNIVLNQLRRLCIDKLTQKRLERPILKKEKYERKVPDFPKEQKKGASFLYPIDEKKRKEFDYIYTVDPKIQGENIFYQFPRIIEDYAKYKDAFKHTFVLVSEVGALSYFPNKNTNFSFHVVNSYTLAYLHALGVHLVTLSYELNDKQIQKMLIEYYKRYKSHPNVEVIVYGYLEAMITKHDMLKHYDIKEGYLEDKYKNKYYVKHSNHFQTIYHYKKLDNKPYKRYYTYGVNAIRFIYIKK